MKMNPKKNDDHHFSSFAMGATIGVIAALLFGTEEGRKLVKEVLDVIPEKYKTVPEKLLHPEEPHAAPTPIIEPLETPHHATYDYEAPPPPPPMVHPYRPL
jgi:hypothetical protein